jgi:glycosyl transferase, family 25
MQHRQTDLSDAGQALLKIFTHIYVINLPDLIPHMAAIHARPLGDPLGGAMHVDGAYSWFRAAHPQCLTIGLVLSSSVQRSSRADIHALRWVDRISVLAPIFGSLTWVRASLRKRL